MLTFVDFFAGIGGFRSGLEANGMKCVGYCEFDKYAKAVYDAIYDTDGEWYAPDVREVKAEDIPVADIWTFGFPCQDISIAGHQKGIKAGTRSGLFYEMVRLLNGAKENKPKWIIVENVRNLLSIDRGWGFYNVLSELGGAGYGVEWSLYNSKDYGVPQNRERVYIVGVLGGHRGRKVLPIPRKSEQVVKCVIPGKQATRVLSIDGVSTTLCANGGGQGGKTGLHEIHNARTFIDMDYKSPKVTEDARCICARYNAGVGNRAGERSGVLEFKKCLSIRSFCDIGDYNPKITELSRTINTLGSKYYYNGYTRRRGLIEYQAMLTPDRLNKRQNGRRLKELGEPMFTLTTQDRHGVLIRNGTKLGYAVAYEGDGIDLNYPDSETRRGRVQTSCTNTLTNNCRIGVLESECPIRIRRLTPRECWRLQGFTDEQFDKAKDVCSETQLYKQAGNAVTVNVVEAIGRHMLKVIGEQTV